MGCFHLIQRNGISVSEEGMSLFCCEIAAGQVNLCSHARVGRKTGPRTHGLC